MYSLSKLLFGNRPIRFSRLVTEEVVEEGQVQQESSLEMLAQNHHRSKSLYDGGQDDKGLQSTNTMPMDSDFFGRDEDDDLESRMESLEITKISNDGFFSTTTSQWGLGDRIDGKSSSASPSSSSLDPHENRSKRWFHGLYLQVAILCLLLILIVSLSVVLVKGKQTAKSLDQNNNSLDWVNPEDSANTTSSSSSSSTLDNCNGGRHPPKRPSQSSQESNSYKPSKEEGNQKYSKETNEQLPFSLLNPVQDLEMLYLERPYESSPLSHRLDHFFIEDTNDFLSSPPPTNAWYQNFILLEKNQEPTSSQRAYAVPYVVDTAGTIPGLRIHNFRIEASSNTILLNVDEPYSVTLGATTNFQLENTTTTKTNGYSVVAATPLGVTLKWDYFSMQSSIVRGMPYGTMIYEYDDTNNNNIVPTIYSEMGLASPPLVDQSDPVDCVKGSTFSIQSEIMLPFESGIQWMVFLSHSVTAQCSPQPGSGSGPFLLQVVERNNNEEGEPFVMRVAMVVPPVNSNNNNSNNQEETATTLFTQQYQTLLRDHAQFYPGNATNVFYRAEHEEHRAVLTLDWNVQSMSQNNNDNGDSTTTTKSEMLMFALPHHQDKFQQNIVVDNNNNTFCTTSMLGPTCLFHGNDWTWKEDLPNLSFTAPRRPDPIYLPQLADALQEDLNYTIPENYRIGAGDTYFSGKLLAKLARIILVASELREICTLEQRKQKRTRSLINWNDDDGDIVHEDDLDYSNVCSEIKLPSLDDISLALDRLKSAVEIWWNGNAQSPFLYDTGWGGIINCGCYYVDGQCSNAFPNCPSLTDQGLNFGNGFYNDHHFHYGYHIYAAATVAYFDGEWGKTNFENVLLLIRDIANPSFEDPSFPVFRHKDWYHGSSWASGITLPLSLDGMNQESTSEAIAAYEAVGLFGKVMSAVFEETHDKDKMEICNEIHNTGALLAATELRSAKRYWQVTRQQNTNGSSGSTRSSGTVDESSSSTITTTDYPDTYEPNVVGILWSTKAFFGTWFGTDPYLIYGIQLLPLTPISEERDRLDWATEMFDPFSSSCDTNCVLGGWSVLVAAMLATLGRKQEAVDHVLIQLTRDIFDSSAGGNGHSKSNTLWYISTRPTIADNAAVNMTKAYPWQEVDFTITCSQPTYCTDDVLETMAGDSSCRSRIQWLMYTGGMAELDACTQIADIEYPTECGPCSPLGTSNGIATEAGFIDGTNTTQPVAQTEAGTVTATAEPTSYVETEAGSGTAPTVATTEPVAYTETQVGSITSTIAPSSVSTISAVIQEEEVSGTLTCFQPNTCTTEVLDSMAGDYSCRARMEWLMSTENKSQWDSCKQVAVDEFPDVCGPCNPLFGNSGG